MSVLISDCYDIANSQVNTSKAKQLYSFSKTNRFGVQARKNHNVLAYDIPGSQSNIGTKFTKSERKSPFVPQQKPISPI